MAEAKSNPRTQRQRKDLHGLIQFLVLTSCRVGEVRELRYRDCSVRANSTGQKILIAEVTGKRGTRTTVSGSQAAEISNGGLRQRGRTLEFASLLEAVGLRKDKHGFMRNLKSLRATGISRRIIEQPDLNLTVIARNVGTSITMIDTFYAKRLTALMHAVVLSKAGELL